MVAALGLPCSRAPSPKLSPAFSYLCTSVWFCLVSSWISNMARSRSSFRRRSRRDSAYFSFRNIAPPLLFEICDSIYLLYYCSALLMRSALPRSSTPAAPVASKTACLTKILTICFWCLYLIYFPRKARIKRSNAAFNFSSTPSRPRQQVA